MTATCALSEFIATTRLADLPPDVVARGSLILADCVGCMVAGSGAPEVRRLLALEVGRGEPSASALGTPVRLSTDAAAYVNGTAGTWHDLDEGNLSTQYACRPSSSLRQHWLKPKRVASPVPGYSRP